ncbi:MAG: hypothetical protein ABR571_14905 [Jatrophihabitans sp.]|uniref:hypothetical protein n=1 Tax=Jatrophihabitans sp. TaxID=1932789 RepID=UPI0039104A6B
MTRWKMALCAAAALSVAAVAAPALAEEEPPPSTTAFVPQVRPVVQASATVARAQFHSRCIGTATTDQLYVAVKEGPTISPTNTSSSGATSYFSTNWMSDAGPNALKRDGKKHVMHVLLHADGLLTGPPPDENTPPPTGLRRRWPGAPAAADLRIRQHGPDDELQHAKGRPHLATAGRGGARPENRLGSSFVGKVANVTSGLRPAHASGVTPRADYPAEPGGIPKLWRVVRPPWSRGTKRAG